MALADYRDEMEMCCRCSCCKFIPLEKVKGVANANACPSVTRFKFHAYSGGGRLNFAMAMLTRGLTYSEKLLEVVYNCQLCGACDISCKYSMDMEVLEPINETRLQCVADGHTIPALDKTIDSLHKQGTMVPGARARRADWAAGLNVKDYTRQNVSVIYHAGCRTAYDPDLWKVARDTVALLNKAGIDFGIAYTKEPCCGSRAYQTGYKEDFLNQARANAALWEKSGTGIVVTGCADCYYGFKVLYDKFNLKGKVEVLHTTEYLARLLRADRLKPARKFSARVTYQDPCHLGRLGEPYIHWQGRQVPGQIRVFDPPREFRRGTHGVYEPPREVLASIPGLSLVEMDRRKEYAWCCGAGGGVKETNPDFARWTAGERIKEAGATGAGAIVTACPGCQRNFRDALGENGRRLKVYDVIELLARSV
ncbi:MAG: (Fe-S)-binding protein [Pseudomonadota bacterium]